ncbi:toxin-antitoxin system HicB family antitoxin [Methylobacterium sp. NEAU 140]|uniref:toxin-antitoxin system HicB family antitoxin n=1 Tax=Methylobacterium sp. NEAU 140 TaxID=3064945 RepID=UPI002735AC36|nr:toxin-antitoxin system HicB family antitoxin [Methylobacterium sp. NEAU 140]MDP4026782.1 toxin-antitoxin system HicB family antitoxin [Methylobacterium sp. NEAU 140]
MDRDDALRLPASLREAAEQVARQDGGTLNQFVAAAVAEKISALQSAGFLDARGARADLVAFDRFMNRSGGTPPAAHDAWEAEGSPIAPTGRAPDEQDL